MLCVGVDLGGSKIAVRSTGMCGLTWERSFRLIDHGTPRSLLDAVLAWLQDQTVGHGPVGTVAIACAPTLDEAGVVCRWPNQPAWASISLAAPFAQALACNVIWCDDGTAATFADAVALDVPNLLHFSLGTGVGGGIFFDHHVLKDRELGHLVVYPGGQPCSCGRNGCLQAYASARSQQSVSRGEEDGWQDTWVDRAAEALSLCTANLLELFHPDVISLSGGVLGQFPTMPERVAAKLPLHTKASLKLPRVVASPHGLNASLEGAVLLAQASPQIQHEICHALGSAALPMSHR